MGGKTCDINIMNDCGMEDGFFWKIKKISMDGMEGAIWKSQLIP